MEEETKVEKQEEVQGTTQGSEVTVDALLSEISKMKLNTVSKEEYEKIKADNAKLAKEVTTSRQVIVEENKEVTKDEIIKRCEERTETIGDGSSYTNIKALCENYRDMEKIGMDVSYIDSNVVEELEEMVKDCKGDENHFKALMESKIKVTK